LRGNSELHVRRQRPALRRTDCRAHGFRRGGRPAGQRRVGHRRQGRYRRGRRRRHRLARRARDLACPPPPTAEAEEFPDVRVGRADTNGRDRSRRQPNGTTHRPRRPSQRQTTPRDGVVERHRRRRLATGWPAPRPDGGLLRPRRRSGPVHREPLRRRRRWWWWTAYLGGYDASRW